MLVIVLMISLYCLCLCCIAHLIIIVTGVNSRLNVISSSCRHLSSVRCVTLSSDTPGSKSETPHLVFSAGGRGQLCAWHACFNTTDESDSAGDSRLQFLTSYSCTRIKSKKRSKVDVPDVRYMSVTAFRAQQVDSSLPRHIHIVAAACSDGIIRYVAIILYNLLINLLCNIG